jgi:hypothetical protein
MPRSPRRRIRLVTVIGGLKVFSRPVGSRKTSADLTPATGARTTRFCRTQPPVFAKRLRRTLAPFVLRKRYRSRDKPALRYRPHTDAAASTTSRPNVRDDGQRPSLWDETARLIVLICPTGEAEYFFGEVWTGQITLNRLDKSLFRRNEVGASLMDGWVFREAL